MVLTRGGPQSPRSKAGAKWLSKIRKGQVAPKGLHLPTESHNLDQIFYYNFYEEFLRDFISMFSHLCFFESKTQNHLTIQTTAAVFESKR